MAETDEKLSEFQNLPEELQAKVRKTVAEASVLAVAPFDLDRHGMYIDGYLLLAETKLGYFIRRNGQWDEHWVSLGDIDSSEIVEGLGMNLLRVIAQDKILLEFRCTLRHVRRMARLQRNMQNLMGGDAVEENGEEPEHLDEKKLRCEKCGRVIPAWSEVCPACMSRRKILFRLLDFIKQYKGRAFAAFCMALMVTGLGMVEMWLRKPLMNRGFGAAKEFDPDYRVVLILVGVIAGVMVFRWVLQVGQLHLSLGLGTLVARKIRNTIYAHMHRLSVSFFSRRQTGALVTRITSDTERLWYFVASTFIEMILAILIVIGVAICMFVMNWKLAFFTLLPVPIMFFLMVFFHNRLHRSFRRMWHRWARLTAVVADALPGVRVIKAFGQENREVQRFEEQSNALYNVEMDYISSVRAYFQPSMTFASSLGILVVWLLGGWWVYKGQADVGTLVAFQGFLMMFLRPIHQLAHMDEMLNRAATSAHRIYEILDTDPAIYSKAGSHSPERLKGRIELRNLSFSYDGVRRVLKNLKVVIEPGTMLGLAGPSGGGKTTLVNLISRFYDPLEGRILIDGVDLRDYDLTALRRNIGVVLQEPFLFHGTVGENIAYGNPDATLDEIIAAARAANAHQFIVGFPDGYDTLVGERGQTLSGGERQRISIARAILNNPTILILDEATSSVDTATEQLIQQALDRLTANRTTIAIAHRLSTLRKADRLIILEKGVIVEEGSHDDLAAREGGLYAKLLKMQEESQVVMGLVGDGVSERMDG